MRHGISRVRVRFWLVDWSWILLDAAVHVVVVVVHCRIDVVICLLRLQIRKDAALSPDCGEPFHLGKERRNIADN